MKRAGNPGAQVQKRHVGHPGKRRAVLFLGRGSLFAF
jgi:hypothetical protein